MNEARAWHCSGQMQINGKIYIIVAGGHCKNSIEILDPSLSDQRWIYGPDLPFRLHGSSMVTSPTDEGVEIIGNSIETLEWNLLEQRLKYARSAHLAFAIPY